MKINEYLDITKKGKDQEERFVIAKVSFFFNKKFRFLLRFYSKKLN